MAGLIDVRYVETRTIGGCSPIGAMFATNLTEALSSAFAVLVEFSLIEVYKGATMLAETVGWMEARNWVVYGIGNVYCHPLDDPVWQIDCVFVPDVSPFRADKRYADISSASLEAFVSKQQC